MGSWTDFRAHGITVEFACVFHMLLFEVTVCNFHRFYRECAIHRRLRATVTADSDLGSVSQNGYITFCDSVPTDLSFLLFTFILPLKSN